MAFNRQYFSQINGNLSIAPYKGEPRPFTYLTTEGVDTITADSFFPGDCGAAIGDSVRVVQVDSLDPRFRTSAISYELVISGFAVA